MDQFGISTLADWLEEQTDALLKKQTILELNKVYAAIDYLKVLKNPAAAYPEMTEETYLQSESDKTLSLLNDKQQLSKLEDRIMVNHVDGSISGDKIKFNFNHDTPYVDGKYRSRKDLEILKFGLEVVGAVAATGHEDAVQSALTPDSVVSLVLAAHALHAWQLA